MTDEVLFSRGAVSLLLVESLCPKRSFLAKLSSIRSVIATDDSNLSWLQRHDLSSASAQTRSSHRLNSLTLKRANITDAQACDNQRAATRTASEPLQAPRLPV
jgi:hypothetical protein